MLKQFVDMMLFRKTSPGEGVPVAPPAPLPSPVAPPPPPASKSGKKVIPAAIAAMIAGTIAMEGGYVNHPADPGGETNMGITKKVAVKNGYTESMRTLPRDVAVSIYYKDYIVAPGFEPLVEVNAPVVEELYDTGVNMGTTWPSKFLQQSLNQLCSVDIAVDGHVGPSTRSIFVVCQNHLGSSAMCVAMLDRLDAMQKARYYGIVKARPSSKVFLKGWLNNRIGNVDRRKCRIGGPK